jgi:hypothetical protein
MSRKNGDFVKACEVFWGEWVPYEDCVLLTTETPETLLMEKESINSLPKECKLLAELIVNLPEEMFLNNGRLKRTFFRKFVKTKTGWSLDKVAQVQTRLTRCLAVSMRKSRLER